MKNINEHAKNLDIKKPTRGKKSCKKSKKRNKFVTPGSIP
jgi:hypothetical protein